MIMKIILLFTILFCLSGCGKHMYSTMSSGKEDASYIIVMQKGSSMSDVWLQIDEQKPILIKKIFKTKMQRKASPIQTTPGKHTLKLVVDGKTIFDEKVFLGLQETKKIILP